MKKRGWASVMLGVVLALTLALSACGGEGEDGKVAAIGDGRTTAGGGSGGAKGNKDPQEAMLAFARCMRKHGVDVPDPQAGGALLAPGPGDGAPSATELRRFEKADDKCRGHMQGIRPPKLSEEDRQALQEASLEHARCMRKHGIDFPDPSFEGGGAVVSAEALDTDDPDFKAAEKECRKHLQDFERRVGSPDGS